MLIGLSLCVYPASTWIQMTIFIQIPTGSSLIMDCMNLNVLTSYPCWPFIAISAGIIPNIAMTAWVAISKQIYEIVSDLSYCLFM